jgi:hypothetical protein
VRRAVLAALGVAAALTLLVSAPPAYDAWSWLAWGREVAHGELSTLQGPSWKPGPVLVTTVLAPLGEAAPAAWLVVARAGALLALVAAFGLGRRIVGGRAGIVAGALAALALALSAGWTRQAAVGNSEGLLAAAVLLAVERHLAGRPRSALGLVALAGLLRPETWPFLLGYAVWLGRREPRARLLIVAMGCGVLALWLLPEWWGSGDPLRPAERATRLGHTSLALAPHPGRAMLEAAWGALAPWARVAALVATVAALVAPAIAHVRARGSARIVTGLAGLAAAWTALVVGMTQAGVGGNPRYLVAGTALWSVVAGAGVAIGLRALATRGGLALAAGVAVVVAATLQGTLRRGDDFRRLHGDVVYQARLRSDLPVALAAAGGRGRVLGCGRLAAEKFSRPYVAWQLGVPLRRIGLDPAPRGYVLAARPSRDSRVTSRASGHKVLARAGPWRVLVAGCSTPRN